MANPRVSTKKSWLDKKLEKKSFKKNFQVEVEKLSIGEQLVKIRLDAGITQAEVARRVGTTASAISRYENAEYDRYELRTLQKIALACGLKLELHFESKAA
jgi:predicted transcriptional regulator